MIQKLKRNWLVALKLKWGTSQILTRTLKSLKNLYFNWLLVTKVYIVWAAKIQRSYLSWHWNVMQILCKFYANVMQILKKNWLLVWKKTWEIWQIFTRALCQNWHFDGILLSKVEKVWSWNLQRSYMSWQWRIMQNLKRNWLDILKLT